MVGTWVDVLDVVAACVLEMEERARKKGVDVLAVEGERWGVVTCLLEPGGVGVAVLRVALRLATDGFPSEMSSV